MIAATLRAAIAAWGAFSQRLSTCHEKGNHHEAQHSGHRRLRRHAENGHEYAHRDQARRFEFTQAEDGQIALEKFKSGDFDIAFVYWNMPNMTGVDFVKEVRKLEKFNDLDPMVTVMVTSERTIGKIQVALDEAGADGFSKPFTAAELRSG